MIFGLESELGSKTFKNTVIEERVIDLATEDKDSVEKRHIKSVKTARNNQSYNSSKVAKKQVSVNLNEHSDSLFKNLENAKVLQKRVRIENNTSPGMHSNSRMSHKASPNAGKLINPHIL